MSAKQSAEMRTAIALYRRGMKTYKAAMQAGVHPASLYRVLDRLGIKRPKKSIDSVA